MTSLRVAVVTQYSLLKQNNRNQGRQNNMRESKYTQLNLKWHKTIKKFGSTKTTAVFIYLKILRCRHKTHVGQEENFH